MKRLQKYSYWFICTVVLVIIALLALPAEQDSRLLFCLKNSGRTEEISIYEAEDGNRYVFLPSYADLEDLTIAMSSDLLVSLGGVTMSNGMSCREFQRNLPYPLKINGEDKANLYFYQSANVATMYIDTESGSMDDIYADQEHREYAALRLYTPSGKLEYIDRNCFLKGRGNSTWDAQKKPFLLRLCGEADLLGMGKDADWVLLANNHDESNLHNKLLLDMADRAIEDWTPRCEYVDLYLNGQYNGLYLLAEKVEIGKNRLDLDTGAGDFLCSVDFSLRISKLDHPFYTANDRTVSICEPTVLSVEAKQRIMNLVNRQERILLSQEDLTQSEFVDIDSWIRKYLVDEIAANTDSDLSSSYFYYSDGVFYGGPVWDYDMALGNTIQTHYPKAFIAKNYLKYSSRFHSVYYAALFSNESFVKRLSEIYEKEFLPVLNDMIDHEIRDTADRIALAARMNQLRWPVYACDHPEYSLWERYINTGDSILYYLKERTAFLTDVLVNKVPYCTVRFELPTKVCWTVSVPCGSVLKNTDVVNEPLYGDIYDKAWHLSGTDTLFDPDTPITEDMVLVAQNSDAAAG